MGHINHLEHDPLCYHAHVLLRHDKRDHLRAYDSQRVYFKIVLDATGQFKGPVYQVAPSKRPSQDMPLSFYAVSCAGR